MLEVTKDNFEQEVKQAEGYVLKMVLKLIQELKKTLLKNQLEKC